MIINNNVSSSISHYIRTELDIANAIYKYIHNHYFMAIIKLRFFDENKYKNIKNPN